LAAAPLISVVMSTLNAARVLPRCLDSLRAQSFRDFEVIVMDGASTDGTVEILRNGGDIVTEWRSAPDTGIYNAWNKALPLMRGEWFCFLGADDRLWDADAFACLAPHLRTAAPRHRIVYGQIRQLDDEGRVIEELGEPWSGFKDRFRSHVCLPHPGLMHHRSLYEQSGGFDERFRLAADYEFLLRELKTGDALFVPSLTVAVGWGGRTTRPEEYVAGMRETEAVLRMHGLRPPAVAWAYWKFLAHFYAALRALVGERAARRLADLYRVLSLRKPRYAAIDAGKPEGPAH
jgi:glycosyltransferase involved in cell wall biosynthesis